MPRKPNTNKNGRPFDLATRKAVWNNTPKYDANPDIRKDVCGAQIRWDYYGDTNSEYGWEIDHIKPIAADGDDELSNLQVLQWRNNRHKGDDFPAHNYCVETN